VADGLVVHPAVVRRRLDEELPFLVTENILMAAVKKGGDRQKLHERLRVLSQSAGERLKTFGGGNELLSMIAADPVFHLTPAELEAAADPARFTGRAPEQVDEFLDVEIGPILRSDPESAAAVSDDVPV
jgi:adenylosuccinate lyase